MKSFVFWIKFHRSLLLGVQISTGSGNGLAANRRQAITWTSASSPTNICVTRGRCQLNTGSGSGHPHINLTTAIITKKEALHILCSISGLNTTGGCFDIKMSSYQWQKNSVYKTSDNRCQMTSLELSYPCDHSESHQIGHHCVDKGEDFTVVAFPQTRKEIHDDSDEGFHTHKLKYTTWRFLLRNCRNGSTVDCHLYFQTLGYLTRWWFSPVSY